ncbi:LysR family transcriptional regulator [uncultured Endozoicomonas sp.]|uniref:LysR family transcriptional regulator n=1 Tax=uncultured Endozoicomonas sp. TaxID=432652 RepID=UPI00262F3E48|nr:LysR family transcriptional regulator [uncultured Endozoicomonas sp.]
MNIARVDLNLMVYLDVLLRERNVTRAAEQLGITQPAMSNGLRRLRELFGDPLLIRTSDGMTPTERALELQPLIREALLAMEKTIQPKEDFVPESSQRVFRIMASDYAESTLIPMVLQKVRANAPNVTLDILTPSDVSFHDVEQGWVDMAINRFDSLPQSFHQMRIWQDDFSCVISRDNPIFHKFTLDAYLASQHIWASKTGMGVGVGVNPEDVQRLGWVDEALAAVGKKRKISVFTRHYQVAMLLSAQNDLIATLPSKLAEMERFNTKIAVVPPPFEIPSFDLSMAWSPLLHHDSAHQWLRQIIKSIK